MGFFTGLVFYRPAPPPIVTCIDLAKWIAAISATGYVLDDGLMSLRVKFGDAVDQDEESDIFDLDCEIEVRNPQSAQEMIELLWNRPERIYRAYAGLGLLHDEVTQPITRIDSTENEIDYCPGDLSLWIGPVDCRELGGDGAIRTGWISLDISGDDYLYPWTFADVVEHLEGSAAIQRLMQVCRDKWPITPDKPSAVAVANRKEIGTLWPYDLNKPQDWYWGLQETG